jgi:hypothetical protein
MNDSGTRGSTGRREILKMKEQAVHNGTSLRSGPRMDYHPGRLFYNGQILILKIDLERDLLWCKWYRFGPLEIHFNGFSTSDAVSGFV